MFPLYANAWLFYVYSGGGAAPIAAGPSENWSTNRRYAVEWYLCQRCGVGYPRFRVKVQNGLILCDGPQTLQCADKPGHAAFFADTDTGYEQIPEDLPTENIEL